MSLDDAVSPETLGVSGDFHPFLALMTNTVNSAGDKTNLHNQGSRRYPPWLMGPNQIDMFHNIMAQQQSMMRVITSLQVDQRSRPQGVPDTLDTQAPYLKGVNHSSELGASLHNVSDISVERSEEKRQEPMTQWLSFWAQ